MRFATWLMQSALRWMPPRRQTWAEAMRSEFDSVPTGEQLGFAAGCLWAAICEGMTVMQLLVTIGRWGVGAVTAVYGAFHLWCLANAIGYLTGHPDAFYDRLLRQGHAGEAAGYHQFLPFIALYLAGMGVGNLLAAAFLVKWRPRLFVAGLAIVATTAAAMTAYDMAEFGFSLDMGFGWQFVPLAMLAGAGVLLAWMAKGKSGPLAA